MRRVQNKNEHHTFVKQPKAIALLIFHLLPAGTAISIAEHNTIPVTMLVVYEAVLPTFAASVGAE